MRPLEVPVDLRGGPCGSYFTTFDPSARESLILGSLFVASFTLCSLVMGAMLLSTPASVKLAGPGHAQVVARTTPVHCVHPPMARSAHASTVDCATGQCQRRWRCAGSAQPISAITAR